MLADAGVGLLVVVALGLDSGVSGCEQTASENKIKPFLKTNADLAGLSSLTSPTPNIFQSQILATKKVDYLLNLSTIHSCRKLFFKKN